MLLFIAKRLSVMFVTIVVLTLIVFYLVNLEPSLRTLAISQTNMRVSDEGIESWLQRNGYRDPFLERYAEWLGVWPREPNIDPETGEAVTIAPRCTSVTEPTYRGVLQGYFGCSSAYKVDVTGRLLEGLAATGVLMFWVMITMVPAALIIGVLAGMREGSLQDRSLSVVSIGSTATPEYVSGILFTIFFASYLGWLNGSAASAMRGVTFENFTLPVMTMAIYGVGYIARMTRASMAEVMTSQYIRTARLKGLGFRSIVLRHALRNALIAPFTVIMLQFPWLLTGVVIVESMFNYKGFGYMLFYGAGNNDIDLLLACSMISVLVVLTTQLISDIGYVYLNPRIRVK